MRASFGIGLSLNEKTSLNFGYDHSYILGTEFTTRAEVEGESITNVSEGQEASIGSFLFGVSYNATDRVGLSLNTSIGATDEAPDATVGLKLQYRLDGK